MYFTIEDPNELLRNQELFERYFKTKLAKRISLEIGHLGASYESRLHTDDQLWYYCREAGSPEPTRYWNAFGLLNIDTPSNIVVEINFPLTGISGCSRNLPPIFPVMGSYKPFNLMLMGHSFISVQPALRTIEEDRLGLDRI